MSSIKKGILLAINRCIGMLRYSATLSI